MAFESLTDRLAGVFKKLRGHGKLTEADIKAAMREVRMALLEADVNYKVAKDFCAKVSERAMGQEVMESLTPAQQVVKIVNEELVTLMGGSEAARLNIKNKGQTIIMLCGLQTKRPFHHTLVVRAAHDRAQQVFLEFGGTQIVPGIAHNTTHISYPSF